MALSGEHPRDAHRQQMIGAKSRVERHQVEDRAHEQAGTHEQQQGDGDLAAHDPPAQVDSAAALPTHPTWVKVTRGRNVRGGPGRDQSQDQGREIEQDGNRTEQEPARSTPRESRGFEARDEDNGEGSAGP